MLYLYFNYYDRLPDRVPTHFRMDGIPDGWSGKSNLLIFVFVAFGLTFFIYLCNYLMPKIFKNPWCLNIPRKAQVLKMGEEALMGYMRLTVEMMAAVAAGLNLLFFLGFYSTIYMILNELTVLPWWGIWIGLPAVLLISIIYTIKLYLYPQKRDMNNEGVIR